MFYRKLYYDIALYTVQAETILEFPYIWELMKEKEKLLFCLHM